MRTYRQVILPKFSLAVHNLDGWVLRFIAGLNNYFFLVERVLISSLFTICNTLYHAVKHGFTGSFRNCDGIIGIPLADFITLLDNIPILEVKCCSIRNVMVRKSNTCIYFNYPHFSSTSDNDLTRGAIFS